MVHDPTDRGATIVRYRGTDGRLRAAARHLSEALTTDEVPTHTFDRVEKLAAGEIVKIDIEVLPVGLEFATGGSSCAS